jgi:phosphatidylethanolamine-binding protein (PEBP) family uncharacterized protein
MAMFMLEKLPESVGEALRRRRAGLSHTAFCQLANPFDFNPITIRSSAFAAEAPMPAKYTADGSVLSPPLEWGGVPDNSQSVVVIVEDADSPTPRPLVHTIIVNLDAHDTYIPEGALNSHLKLPCAAPA